MAKKNPAQSAVKPKTVAKETPEQWLAGLPIHPATRRKLVDLQKVKIDSLRLFSLRGDEA